MFFSRYLAMSKSANLVGRNDRSVLNLVLAAGLMAVGPLATGIVLQNVVPATAQAATPNRPSQVGKQVESFQLSDFRGKSWSLSEVQDKQIVVVAFLGTECPLMQYYGPRLQELASKYEGKGVAVIGINANRQDSLTELGHFARQAKIEFPLLKDPSNKIADQFQASRTPEVFVLDKERVIRYQGRIDDQFTVGIQRKSADHSFLTDAIETLLKGEKPAKDYVEPVGCLIGRVLESQEQTTVTYTKEVSRILQKHCVNCHRPGEIGPFSLTSFEETVGWGAMIKEVISDERMPPWNANPAHGKFANDARLSDEEKQTLIQWIDGGAPEGNPADLPPAPKFVDGWQIGEPDAIFYISEKGYSVPASGEVRYQYFKVDPGFTEDKWVQMAECRPGNRAVVHHIIVGIESPSGGRSKVQQGVHSSWLVATAPGAPPMKLREGQGKLVPAGSKLVFQMHYTPNGTPQTDRSCVGLKFVDADKVTQQVGTDEAGNVTFQIPPGAENFKVDAYKRFGTDTYLLAMFPHMHVRGKAFRYTAVFPDGKEEILLDVPRYDFNWQHTYALAEPRLLPAGTRLHCEGWFDNSENNLANPDPKATVRWGDQTWEEMMLGYFAATPAAKVNKTNGSAASKPSARTERFLQAYANQPGEGTAKIPAELLELAKNALQSDEALERFGKKLQEAFPQIDRCCWTSLEENTVCIRMCVQTGEYAGKAGGKGRKVPAMACALAKYAKGSDVVVHGRLDDEQMPDMQYMSRYFHSSVHFPQTIASVPGTVNFWSSEERGFPQEAKELLQELAKQMAAGAASSPK